MSKNKVEIYVKGRKDKCVEVKVKSKDDVKDLIRLCKSEVFRRSYLADIDYEDNSALVFKIDGEKIPCQKLLASLMRVLDKDIDNDDEKDHKKKKNKDKKKDKKKKHKKHHDDNEKYHYPTIHKSHDDDSDHCVTIHRIKKDYYYN